MTERHSRSVVVLDSAGRACGVVTGRDVIDAGERTKVDELMTPPQTIGPDASLRDAADKMIRLEVHRLVVVDDVGGAPLGLISTMDIVAEMADTHSVWRD
jgi:CBS domain-containing protein